MANKAEWDFVIHAYSMDQAIADGVLTRPPGKGLFFPADSGGMHRVSTITTGLVREVQDVIRRHVPVESHTTYPIDLLSWAVLGIGCRDAKCPEGPTMYVSELRYDSVFTDTENTKIWFLPDGYGDWTMLRPSDY